MTTENNITIGCSNVAAKHIAEVMAAQENPKLKLRVYIIGGGCSGFQYGFKFDDVINDDDLIININNIIDSNIAIAIIVDALSFNYIEGATIDYVQDLLGSRFVIVNPNAQTTCGCGSSFSV